MTFRVSVTAHPRRFHDETCVHSMAERAPSTDTNAFPSVNIERQMWVDNYGGHNETPEVMGVLHSKNIRIRKLVACGQLIKSSPAIPLLNSRLRTNGMHFGMIVSSRLSRTESGEMTVEQTFSSTLELNFAAEAVCRINAQTDRNGISFARKTMIRCGLY
uniref:Uncharacterized protein n=1 Tax=Spongospora subterranea TaxID=70186 RepID=A0A0H5QTA7_9EUKA|eukprot:CRZ05170.1 hypothetical protein [Spongospora subterranea]